MRLAPREEPREPGDGRPVLTHELQASCPRVLLPEAERVEALSAPKVHDLDGVEVGHHDVVGLQVQVEDAPAVEVLHPLQDLHQVAHHVILRVAEPFRDKDTFNPCHRKEEAEPGFKGTRRQRGPHLSVRLTSSSLPVQYSATSTR